MNARAYVSLFGFRGSDQQKRVGALSGIDFFLNCLPCYVFNCVCLQTYVLVCVYIIMFLSVGV